MRIALTVLILAAFAASANAALMPYYQMDSLAFLATDVVLCDEVGYLKKKKDAGAGGYDYYEATFTVVKGLKGSSKEKEKLIVEVDTVYVRDGGTYADPKIAKRDKLPMGRALLFLNREKDKPLRPVLGGVKLVIDGEAYCYGQFGGNPGPFYLARMAPENVTVPADKPYDEKLLLKDVEEALWKAKDLTKATGQMPWRAGRREAEKSK